MLDCRCYGRSTYHKQSVVLLYKLKLTVPYSGKFSLGANFRDFRRQTCFREYKNHKKKCTKMEIDDVITCVRRYELNLVNEMVLCVCPLNGCCKEESACYHTKYQQIHKRHSEVVEVEISSTESNTPVSLADTFRSFPQDCPPLLL